MSQKEKNFGSSSIAEADAKLSAKMNYIKNSSKLCNRGILVEKNTGQQPVSVQKPKEAFIRKKAQSQETPQRREFQLQKPFVKVKGECGKKQKQGRRVEEENRMGVNQLPINKLPIKKLPVKQIASQQSVKENEINDHHYTITHTNSSAVKHSIEELSQKIDSLNRRVVAIESSTCALNSVQETMELNINSMKEKINSIEKLTRATHKMLSDIVKNQTTKTQARPDILPFRSIADLLAFDYATDEELNETIKYLNYIRGISAGDTAAKFIKNCFVFNDELYSNLTWKGLKLHENVVRLETTRFAAVCEDAMPIKKDTLQKPNQDEFVMAMTRALKSAKETFRRTKKRVLDGRDAHEEPLRQWRRMEDHSGHMKEDEQTNESNSNDNEDDSSEQEFGKKEEEDETEYIIREEELEEEERENQSETE